jgi:hypothetical protein
MSNKFEYKRVLAAILLGAAVSSVLILPSTASASNWKKAADPISQVSASLQSKYKYFKNNKSKVVLALLETKCSPTGYSFIVKDGPTIWVKQTRKFKTNSLSGWTHPMIEYRPATNASDTFKLRSGGESKKWWQKMWGCPLTEGVGGTYWGVSMTTQQLIKAGY